MAQLNLLSQQYSNSKNRGADFYMSLYSALSSFLEKSTDRFSDLLLIREFLPIQDYTENFQNKIKTLDSELSCLNKKLMETKDDKSLVKIMSGIRELKILQESLEILLLTNEEIETIRQTSRRFQKKAQSSVVPEKYLK